MTESTPATGATAKTVVVMQPYLFPYLAYYQLARAADEFVFLDDAAFIKQGFVNRNSVLLDGAAHRFTAPVREADSFRTIAQHDYVADWRPLLGLLASAYRKAPHWRSVQPLLDAVLRDGDRNVATKNMRSIRLVCEFLGIDAPRWSLSSALDPSSSLRGQERVLALCRTTGATTYVNAPGGRALYAQPAFSEIGVALRFIESCAAPYKQAGAPFQPNLSMLDALMYCDREDVARQLDAYALAP